MRRLGRRLALAAALLSPSVPHALAQAGHGSEKLRPGEIAEYFPILSRLHTPQLGGGSDTIFGLFSVRGRWPGDSLRYRRLLDLAERFAPILQSTNFSLPRDFEHVLPLDDSFGKTVCRSSISLVKDVWRLDRPSPERVDTESGPIELGLRPDAPCAARSATGQAPTESLDEVRKLLRAYDPDTLQRRLRRDRDTVLYWNFPGETPREWWKFYARVASDRLASIRVYVHPFLFRHQSATGAARGWELVLQYWFFYPFNDGVNNHEGDWEHINVSLSTRARLAGSSRYGRLLDSTEVTRILTPNGGLPLEALAISAVDYYFHHWVVTIDYKPVHDPKFADDTALYDREFQERFGAIPSLTDSTVRLPDLNPSGWDDPELVKDSSLADHPVVFIGGANKSVLQLLSTASQENKNTHGSYPYPGLWMGVGAKATERVFGQDKEAYQTKGDPGSKGGGRVDPRTARLSREDLALLPDWEVLYPELKDPATPDAFVREWSWLVLPIRWGYPATRSIGTGVIADYDFGNVSPVGPAHNPGWNRVGAGPNFERFDVNVDRRRFRRATHDYITPQFWPLTMVMVPATAVPPFSVLAHYLVSLVKAPRPVYQTTAIPARIFDVGAVVSPWSSGHAFHFPPGTGAARQASSALGSSITDAVPRRVNNTKVGVELATHLSPKLETETLVLHGRGTLTDALLDATGTRAGVLERDFSAWEVFGAFRYDVSPPLPLNIQPFARFGYGWSWYGVDPTARLFDASGAEVGSVVVSRPEGGRFPLGFLPNSALMGVGMDLPFRLGHARSGFRVSYNLLATKRLPGRSELFLQVLVGQ